MCFYREDLKNFDRFNLVVQSILYLGVCQLKFLKKELVAATLAKAKNAEEPATGEVGPPKLPAEPKTPPGSGGEPILPIKSSNTNASEEAATAEPSNEPSTSQASNEIAAGDDQLPFEEEPWTMDQKEKLMQLVSKIFLLNFPLYLACKHSAFSRLDDLAPQEITNLSVFCDLHDTEIPVYLLRNVNLFCKTGGICAMSGVFESATADNLPVSMAHAIVAAVGDLKLWLNYRAVSQFFLPLRSKVLKYMCSLEDKELRVPSVKTMAG